MDRRWARAAAAVATALAVGGVAVALSAGEADVVTLAPAAPAPSATPTASATGTPEPTPSPSAQEPPPAEKPAPAEPAASPSAAPASPEAPAAPPGGAAPAPSPSASPSPASTSARKPFAFDAAYGTDEPREVVVQYGDSGSCPHRNVTHVVQETADRVVVTLEADAPTEQPCTADYQQRLVPVRLQSPMGDRELVDGSRGEPVAVDRSCARMFARPPPPRDCEPT